MSVRDAILGLFRQGWSHRRIARELGVNRRTVKRYIALAEKESKCTTNPTPGSDRPVGAEFEGQDSAPPALPGPPRKCGPFREIVSKKLDAGLSAQRVWQDLKVERDFAGSYQSVKRFCRRLGRKTALPFRRIEVEPGVVVGPDRVQLWREKPYQVRDDVVAQFAARHVARQRRQQANNAQGQPRRAEYRRRNQMEKSLPHGRKRPGIE